jgi:hypothetical protein
VPEPDVTERGELSTVLHSAQVSLEMVHDPEPMMRTHTEDNDMQILSGQYDATTQGPIRTTWGTSLVTREASLNLLTTASREFGAVFGGCEMVLPEGDVGRRDSVVHYIATIVGSQFQHPDYTRPAVYDNKW